MTVVSVCLPLDSALSAYCLGWVSLILETGSLFTAAPAKCSHCSLLQIWGSSSWLLPLTSGARSIKDRNARDLTEAEDIKKRGQEYTEELYKKDLHDPDNHYGVITHLEQDILECEVKWTLGSITTNKASGGDGIPVELFQILKDDA